MLTPSDIHHRKLLLIMPKEKLDVALQLQMGTLLYKVDDKNIDKLPLHSLLAIFFYGKCTISSELLKEFASHAVSIFFLNTNFELHTSFIAETKANYLLRQKQYYLTEDQELTLARQLIQYKIKNQYNTLTYFKKELFSEPDISLMNDAQSILGIEGSTSSLYFSRLFDSMNWHKRLPQAKPDEINILMDIGYTMLFNLTDAMLSLFGFDTYKGFYHKLFLARKSLARDLMEPARPIIDAAIVTMYRHNIFQLKDFEVKNKSYQFAGGWKTRQKYASYFVRTLSQYKEELFLYIRQYYFSMDNPEKYQFQNIQIDFAKLPQSLE